MTAAQLRDQIIVSRREQLLTVKEFACLTRQHIKSVYRRIARGEQPGVEYYGREIRIDLAAARSHQPKRGRPKTKM